MLRVARGARSTVAVAASAGILAETLRRIEAGRVPACAFITVAAPAGAVGPTVDELLTRCVPVPPPTSGDAAGTGGAAAHRTGRVGSRP
ncbi:XRE family transcriptional regulator [Streptomyces pratensis]|uniref:XRE family transcriptional regulator n=1 Tax=Streptomyces pratensis TaxID=1169025 RepID=UPI003632C548